MAPKAVEDAAATDTTPTESDSQFWSFTDEAPPEDDSKRAKYDNLIALCLANPDRWAKLTRTFTSNATATNLRKRYADYVGENGEVIEVRAVRVNDLSGKSQYEVYVRATANEDDIEEDVAS